MGTEEEAATSIEGAIFRGPNDACRCVRVNENPKKRSYDVVKEIYIKKRGKTEESGTSSFVANSLP